MSPEAQDFVRRLLRKDPKSRMQLSRVKDHPWIQRYAGGEGAVGGVATSGGAAAVAGGGGGGGGGGSGGGGGAVGGAAAPTPAAHGTAARVPYGVGANAPTPAHAFSTVSAAMAPAHLFASSGLTAAAWGGGTGGGAYR